MAYQWHTLIPLCVHVWNVLNWFICLHAHVRSECSYSEVKSKDPEISPAYGNRTHSRDRCHGSIRDQCQWVETHFVREDYPATKYHLLLSQGCHTQTHRSVLSKWLLQKNSTFFSSTWILRNRLFELKGIVHPSMKVSSFTHPHVFPNLCMDKNVFKISFVFCRGKKVIQVWNFHFWVNCPFQ